ncbi:MAG TPA: Lpg1974 family pore-forming outer membrane protein, partial [Gammaproteobacteria bacterium]|nr:Lpg1974 family pore-forming outer membrane protein [Gammaproteobacteria bacterium]
MKKLLFLLLIAFVGPSFAFQGFQVKEGDRFAFMDLLLWKASVSSSDNWSQVITSDTYFESATLNSVPFKYNTGYRIGLGYQKPQNFWDALFYFTSYKTRGVDQENSNVYSDYVGNFFVNNTDGGSISKAPYYGLGAIQWKLIFNTLDLELGRSFKMDKFLILRPYLGLKAALINQSMYTSWQNPVNVATFTKASENLQNNYWGLGPVLGLKSTWPLYQGKPSFLELYGDLSGGLLWGHWSFADHYSNNQPMSVTVNHSDLIGAS